MSDTNTALGTDGAPILLPVGGKKYKLMPRTKKMEGTFSEWMKAAARQEVYATRDEQPRGDYLAQLNDIAERAANGHYAFHRQLAQEKFHTPEGLCFMLGLMLEKHQPGMTEDEIAQLIIDYGDEITAILKEINYAGKSESSAQTATT